MSSHQYRVKRQYYYHVQTLSALIVLPNRYAKYVLLVYKEVFIYGTGRLLVKIEILLSGLTKQIKINKQYGEDDILSKIRIL